jgi:outer membrane biosynthesis protein TonB
MKRTSIAATAQLLVSLAVVSYAQPARDSDAQEQEPTKPHEVMPPPREPETNTRRGEPETKPPREERETNAPKADKHETPKPSNEQQKPTGKPETSAQQQRKARPTGKGAHIPDTKFKASFGRQHAFAANRVITTTTIVPNQTRFVLSGYTFVFLEPWPEVWLFSDDCYIDFVDDGYFLYDVVHPGVRVALLVVE